MLNNVETVLNNLVVNNFTAMTNRNIEHFKDFGV